MHHEGYKPRSLRERHGSWLGFVAAMGDLTPQEEALVRDGRAAAFLTMLETTPMTRRGCSAPGSSFRRAGSRSGRRGGG
jgi:hypothetical protein